MGARQLFDFLAKGRNGAFITKLPIQLMEPRIQQRCSRCALQAPSAYAAARRGSTATRSFPTSDPRAA
jgi:hypothetical protein